MIRGVAVTALLIVPAVASPQAVEIDTDPRVELLSAVFRLAGAPEYDQCRLPGYQAAMDAWIGTRRHHRVVAVAQELRDSLGMGFNAVMSLAVHLGEPPALIPRVPLEGAPELDERWTDWAIARFLPAVRSFAADVRFMDFLASQSVVRELARMRLREVFDQRIDPSWFQSFFGGRAVPDLHLYAALCNGGANYGARVRVDSATEFYAIVGVPAADSAGNPVFTDDAVPTIVHEFSHSYVNPVVSRHNAAFARPMTAIFAWAGAEMRRHAYGSWEIVLDESLVRAAVIRYLARHEGPTAAERQVRNEIERGFVWMDGLARLMAEYEAERDRYPTFESYLPRVATWFDQVPAQLDSLYRVRG